MTRADCRRLLGGMCVAVVLASVAISADALLSAEMTAEMKAKIAYCANPDLSWWDWTVNNCWFWS